MAFTLSETLIALVIIGIIAAITVPTIVARQREQATVEKVKKFYSTMSNAVKRAIVDTGLQIDEWTFGGGDSYTRASSVAFMKYLKPYLIIAADDCGTTKECYSTVYTKKLSGTSWVNYYKTDHFYKAALNDGSIFWLRTAGQGCKGAATGKNVCALVWYDINGTKSPNQLGKDTFYFVIYKNKLIPSGGTDCNKKSDGWGCALYILTNGNMDYLH